MTKKLLVDSHKGRCINSNFDFIYIGIPKNASTSIRHILGDYNDNYINLLERGGREGKVVFTVIRNPLLRFISGYLEIINRVHRNDKDTMISFYKCLLEVVDEEERLRKFVELCEEALHDVHMMKQIYFLTDLDGKLFEIDDILLFEDFNFEFNMLAKKHGKNFKMVFQNYKPNISVNKCAKVLKENPDLTQRINVLYQEDWEIYDNAVLKRLHEFNEFTTEKLVEKRRISWMGDYIEYHLLKQKTENKNYWLRYSYRLVRNFFRNCIKFCKLRR